MHLIVQLDDAWIFDIEIRKQNPLPGHDASMAEAAPGRVERDERGEARRAHTTPNGGPHLDLERLRLKTCLNLSARLLRRHGQHICTYIHMER